MDRDPKHAKVLQQLGWLHHQQNNSYSTQEQGIEYLEKSVASGKSFTVTLLSQGRADLSLDQNDAQSWYLLGRCYMSQQKYPKAYEAYQQAVYRDGKNPTFWCSIGVLYYQINQYRDALDAYSRAIRLNPNISEVWYDLGTLVSPRVCTTPCDTAANMPKYESCNNQTADALDAYQRAAELDPDNIHIRARLQLLQDGQPTNGMPNQSTAPLPQDVHPQAYQPTAINGPPGPQWGAPAPAPPPQAPPPQLDYNRHQLAAIQQNPQGPQQLQPYDQREVPRPPSLPGPPHPSSPPRQEPPRHYQEGPRGPLRRLTPSPKTHHALPPNPPYAGGLPPPRQMAEQSSSHVQAPPSRISNPNYVPQTSSGPLPPPPPPPQSADHNNGGPTSAMPPMPYGRASPPQEMRPIHQNRPPSDGQYPHHLISAPRTHHPPPGDYLPHGPPTEPPVREREREREREEPTRTPIPPKRHREWDDEPNSAGKGPHSDEKRQRIDDMPRGLPPVNDRPPVSPIRPHQVDDARRAEEHRRLNEGYHPSEAAHHPPSLAPLPPQPRLTPPQVQQAPAQHSLPPPAPEPVEEELPREHHEPAARKMDVDENYDDDEDDRRPAASGSVGKRESPRSERAHGLVEASGEGLKQE